ERRRHHALGDRAHRRPTDAADDERQDPTVALSRTLSRRRAARPAPGAGARVMDTLERRRVAVTGIGLVTPLGVGVAPTWDGVVAGRSGVGPITHFDASAMTSRIAGEVRGFRPADFMPARDVDRMDPFIRFAVAAAREAADDARLRVGAGAARAGAVIGV